MSRFSSITARINSLFTEAKEAGQADVYHAATARFRGEGMGRLSAAVCARNLALDAAKRQREAEGARLFSEWKMLEAAADACECERSCRTCRDLWNKADAACTAWQMHCAR